MTNTNNLYSGAAIEEISKAQEVEKSSGGFIIKPLPPNFKYVFFGDNNIVHAIVHANISDDKLSYLRQVLQEDKGAPFDRGKDLVTNS